MTDKTHDDQQGRQPGALGSNEGLGPLLPESTAQANTMTLVGEEFSAYERGHWYSPAWVQRRIDAERASERERWKQAAEAMAQEADHKFTMDGTTAHWLRALVAKRWA